MYTIALFGEAQRGDFQTAYFCKNLAQLSDFLGEPPTSECRGIYLAIQALLFERKVIYFRVHEEGFSVEDYLLGLNFLEKKDLFPEVTAICLPGVGSTEIINATSPIVHMHKSYLILSEKDFYDYLTCNPKLKSF